MIRGKDCAVDFVTSLANRTLFIIGRGCCGRSAHRRWYGHRDPVRGLAKVIAGGWAQVRGHSMILVLDKGTREGKSKRDDGVERVLVSLISTWPKFDAGTDW